ncbi:MAG: TonB-dependent receptor [Acidobacteria bacterium]|nr:TonB-dependent receptor [Acidobacteriota bacterium]
MVSMSSRLTLPVAAVTFAWLLAAPSPSAAQVVGANLSGTIVDPSQAALPGVTVTVRNTATGREQTLVTGPEGHYRAVALQPGPYEVSAELPGFGTMRRQLTLVIGADLRVDFEMGVATLQESVTVTGQSPLIEVTKSAPTTTIVEEQIQALPVLERNFLSLAQLMPGAAPNYTSKFSRVKFGGPADQRNGYTTIVDGGDLDDAIWGDPTVNISQDAVQEFKVFRNQFDAQYGAALAAVVTVITRSGTNDLHGSGYFFGRDDALNARNAFQRTKPVYEQQRAGGSVGGPLIQNRTHYFGAYEYTNVGRENIISLPASNPFAARENGVFPAGSREHMLVTKWDHRLASNKSIFVRYAFDDQWATRTGNPGSDTANVNDSSKMHSVIGENSWVLSQNLVNTLRAHWMWNEVATLPVSFGPGEVRPSVTSFNRDNPATFPFAFVQQTNGLYQYDSHIVAAYAQDDWRLSDRLTVNLGLRYDLDTNLRMNGIYEQVLGDPQYAGLENFVSRDRGNDADNLQPRLGLTYDISGRGTLVARGGWGMYVTRHRHYFGLTAQDRLLGAAVRIENPEQLRNYPDINAVLGGRSLADYVQSGAARSLYIVPDDYVLPQSQNTTVGVGWQISNSTGLDVDYVHAYGYNQLGALDLNLPASGPISAANPRPVRQFTEVKSLENLSKSWYDALETQLRTRVRGTDSLQVSYTLSRSYRDGVNHYQTYPGTMRTPQERGYSEMDSRHNLSVAGSTTLPWAIQFSGIIRALSGTPHGISAGFDIDGDGQSQGDRPVGLPITVGRENVDESLALINTLRASRNLAPITAAHLQLEPFITADLRFNKLIRLAASRQIELFVEGYNVLNRVNYAGGGNGSIISPAFLVRNAARNARQIQLGARVSF